MLNEMVLMELKAAEAARSAQAERFKVLLFQALTSGKIDRANQPLRTYVRGVEQNTLLMEKACDALKGSLEEAGV